MCGRGLPMNRSWIHRSCAIDPWRRGSRRAEGRKGIAGSQSARVGGPDGSSKCNDPCQAVGARVEGEDQGGCEGQGVYQTVFPHELCSRGESGIDGCSCKGYEGSRNKHKKDRPDPAGEPRGQLVALGRCRQPSKGPVSQKADTKYRSQNLQNRVKRHSR